MTIEVTNRTYAWSRMDTIMMIGGDGGGDFHDWYVAAIGTDTGILHHGGKNRRCVLRYEWSIIFRPVGGGRWRWGVTRVMRARFNTGRMNLSELCVTLMFVTAE